MTDQVLIDFVLNLPTPNHTPVEIKVDSSRTVHTYGRALNARMITTNDESGGYGICYNPSTN